MITSPEPSRVRFSIVAASGLLIFIGLAMLFAWRSVSASPREYPISAAPLPAQPAQILNVPARSPASTDMLACEWSIVASPNQGTDTNILSGVAVAGTDDVWSVGYYLDTDSIARTLIEQWNGSTWDTVNSPNLGTNNNYLNGVSATSANDAWAVGYYSNGTANQTLVEHWDGSTWSIAPTPDLGMSHNYLTGVVATSSSDVWAVGYYLNTPNSPNQTLIEHWNGSAWSVINSPNVGVGDDFTAVSAISASDVWAVGEYYSSPSTASQTLVEHWDGSIWSVVSSPNIGTGYNGFFGVAAASSSDVWAVGDYYSSPLTTYQTLIAHWNGSMWNVVPSPNVGTLANFLTGVSALSVGDVWVVGHYDLTSDPQSHLGQTLVEHWDGTSWNVVSSPNVGSNTNELLGVAAASNGDVWAVGRYYSGLTDQTLIESYNSCSLTPTGTPEPTNSPTGSTSTPTYTSVPTTRTLTPTYTPIDTPLPPTATATATNCTPGWNLVPSPNHPTNSELVGVAAVGPDDVWAVGGWSDNDPAVNGTLIEHWDGTQWGEVPSISPGNSLNNLTAVSATSSNDVWAVGNFSNIDTYFMQTLIEHWDGSSWSVVPSPNAGSANNYLMGVSAVSSSDVWAVGYDDDYMHAAFTEHWDGASWTVVPGPDVNASDAYFYSVTAISTNDVWAVGIYYDRRTRLYPALIEHWDGTSWSQVSSPDTGTSYVRLTGISAVSASDIWAVGFYESNGTHAVVEHWDGISWSVIPNPGSPHQSLLLQVSAISSSGVWAVGNIGSRTLVEHWDGSAWNVVPSPNPGAVFNYLQGVAAAGPGNVWAVGDSNVGNDSILNTLTEHYTSCAPAPSPTFTATGTPPTNTPFPPTSTPTFCTLRFSDVSVGSTFYPYVRCMACHGIITGYPCGGTGEPCNTNNDPYFRPMSNVTRGQFAKIASSAAGFIEPVGEQQYEDVLPGSTFYDFIWRLTSRRYVAGYACGGVGEPCGTAGLPYFRPNTAVTRGQLAKIDANAAGYYDSPGAQQFEDVPPGSTFYEFFWRLANRGLVSGYPCGGVSEPCGPGNLAYFRPSANTTRGQASKIVSSTFFPDCPSSGIAKSP